jgi:2'-5' RNA ligase
MGVGDPVGGPIARSVAARERRRFREISRLHNHWARSAGPPAYYWYLTFEDCTALHALVEHCRVVTRLSCFDFTPPSGLHMTLDRIAVDGEIAPRVLRSVADAARDACRDMAPFEFHVGGLGGTPGAIGFSAFPREPIRQLRDVLRAATLSVHPGVAVKASEFHPHVAIAYCNADVPAAPAVAAVERLVGLAPVAYRVTDVALVLLERLPRAYSWREVERVRVGA